MGRFFLRCLRARIISQGHERFTLAAREGLILFVIEKKERYEEQNKQQAQENADENDIHLKHGNVLNKFAHRQEQTRHHYPYENGQPYNQDRLGQGRHIFQRSLDLYLESFSRTCECFG